jgi:para-nitrobenzyl esterase
VGATRDEFSGLVLAAPALFDGADPVALLERTGMDPTTATRYVAVLSGRDAAAVLAQSVTDRMFRRHVVQWSRSRTAAPAATFAYDFAWRSPVDGLSGHCLDVPFVWDVLADEHVPAIAGDDPPQSLADSIHGAYVAFIRDRDPGWPRWDGDGPVMTWDAGSSLRDSTAYASARALLEPPSPAV